MLGSAGSKLPVAVEPYRRVAEGYGVAIDFRLFTDKSEIGPLMRELQVDSGAMLLFSPGITKDALSEIVNWQNRLGFPVLGHFESEVRAGLLAGIVIDIDKASPKLAEYIDKLLQGRSAQQLPDFYYSGKMVINLRSASMLRIDISPEVTLLAEIIR